MKIVIRHAEPDDHQGMQRVFKGFRAVAGTCSCSTDPQNGGGHASPNIPRDDPHWSPALTCNRGLD